MTDLVAGYHVILCEGFDDQVFWSGWLQERMRCEDGRERRDAHGRTIEKGCFHFHTPRGSSIVIRPYRGRANLTRAVRVELAEQQIEPIRRLVINLDSDAEDDTNDGAREAIRQIANHYGASVGDPCSETFEVDGATVSTIIWECLNDSTVPGVPKKQTLERLIAASIQAVYPGRGASVERWLDDEPKGGTSHKNYGLSYLAKWYARVKANEFYRAVWRDERVAAELRSRLEATGAWDVVEALVAD